MSTAAIKAKRSLDILKIVVGAVYLLRYYGHYFAAAFPFVFLLAADLPAAIEIGLSILLVAILVVETGFLSLAYHELDQQGSTVELS
ncbi:hypothetical protein VCB98_13480 [Gammaproteobacteria bacterium AB-CW1]|uniref:Uncharacterized protein n=1 Tax=Natronospira elongata TaxID=3110268 RepID=A0AAP6ML38_9GAMM|nr:hypothetical protein [Gammaproteobacteria bacterium AB-CW1]